MSQNPVKILIAENEDAILEIMAQKIASQGYDVIMARDGQEAWDKIGQTLPDVVLLDLGMPKMDGWSVLSHLRKSSPVNRWIPVIIISAMNELDSIKRAMDLQADLYLTKPCAISDILQAIRRVLGLIPTHRQPEVRVI
ncbi:MAG: response regulator [Candidatus Omnitrophica bacterium]|nr:response regulator [Candidatus Omnitrophota bacterium]